MLGSIISAGMKVGGAIIGGAAASKAAKQSRALLDNQKQQNEAWYNQRYNEDYTQRADSQAALQNAKDVMEEMYSRSTGASAVTGATDASAAMEKANANKAIADTTSTIASNADSYKSNIEGRYMSQKDALNAQQSQIYKNKAAAIQEAATQMGSAGTALEGLWGEK